MELEQLKVFLQRNLFYLNLLFMVIKVFLKFLYFFPNLFRTIFEENLIPKLFLNQKNILYFLIRNLIKIYGYKIIKNISLYIKKILEKSN